MSGTDERARSTHTPRRDQPDGSDAAVTGEESPAAATVAPQLGPALRRRRKAAGMTMQELADQCGLSQPFLSQIENSRAMPSLITLHRVAQALGTTTVGLLDPAYSEVTLVRAGEGESFVLAEGATTRFLTPGEGHRLEANETTAQPGVATGFITHEGQELVRVLEGSMTICLGAEDALELHAGDTISYPSMTPHQWISGDSGVRFIIITSPPSF